MPCMHVPFTKQITYKRELTEIVKMKYDYMMTHTARRSFCSNEFIKGTDPMIIMAISGHKSYKSFIRCAGAFALWRDDQSRNTKRRQPR